jgi:hypothetical protein
MRTILFYLLGVLTVIAPKNVLSQKCYPEPMSFGNERGIDTTQYIKHHDEVDDQDNAFPRHFKHKDHSNLKWDPLVFQFGQLIEKLYLPVREKMYRDKDCQRQNCVAAVQISHGLVNDRLTLIFEPLYMKLKSITIHPTVDSLNFHNYVFLGKQLIYSAEGTSPIDFHVPSDVDFVTNAKKLYREKMIKQPKQGFGAPTEPLDEFDATSVIFSFQEIIKFNHAIQGRNADGNYYCGEMEFHHGAVFYKNNSASPPTSKHSLFLAKKNWTLLKTKDVTSRNQLKILVPASEDDGANLAHLCPPRCSDLSYPAQD